MPDAHFPLRPKGPQGRACATLCLALAMAACTAPLPEAPTSTGAAPRLVPVEAALAAAGGGALRDDSAATLAARAGALRARGAALRAARIDG
jgi:hypothetical protein